MSEIDEQQPDTDAPAEEAEPDSDPFEGWPAAESSAVIEDAPAEGVSVEHVRGEVQVPDGFTVLEGTPLGKRRSVGVVVSRFNGGVTDKMLQGALDALTRPACRRTRSRSCPCPARSSCRSPPWRSRRPAAMRASSRSARSCAARRRTSTTSRPRRVGAPARGDRDRRAGRLRRADRRHRRAGGGADPQGGRGGALRARDGRPVRPAQGKRPE